VSKRLLNKLSARQVASVSAPGRYGDGGGLYLVVTRGNDPDEGGSTRKWVFRFVAQGRQRDMGLGPADDISLLEARELAANARAVVRSGRDPIEDRRQARADAIAIPTFGELADQLIEGIEDGFKNAKHRAQWRMTLTTYAKPLRSKPVDHVTTQDVLNVLQPIWQSKPETASRLRGRIERVLDAAKARGFRTGENPARWRGHLDAILPKPRKLARGHHKALPFDQAPGFGGRLRAEHGMAARALEFTILTAARAGETVGASGSEINFETNTWTIPAGRMKAGREHRVPLSARAVEILRGLPAFSGEAFVFPGARKGRPLSIAALSRVLKRMGFDCTVHGFRSSFRDWAGERTHFPREVAEAALAHVVGDETEQAYRRGDALEKRRSLMEAWAAFCEPQAGNVIQLPARA
jgi:integrase